MVAERQTKMIFHGNIHFHMINYNKYWKMKMVELLVRLLQRKNGIVLREMKA
jgi:hypothetical protein